MPPSTVKVRNGSPTTASTTASQTQILVATTSPSLTPSRSELCLAISPPRTGRMHSALVEDLRDAREGLPGCRVRSEEHTSELQSLTNLVCRLLLEKKKKKKQKKQIKTLKIK